MLTASFHYSILESFREQMVETTQDSLFIVDAFDRIVSHQLTTYSKLSQGIYL